MKELTLEIIQKCANNCNYCSSNSNKFCTYIIEFEKCKDIIDQAIELGFTHINLSGGEPFLHPDIIKICMYIKKKRLKLTIYSSGIFFNNNNKCSISKDLLFNSRADKIIFNMQTVDKNIYKRTTCSNHSIKLLLKTIKNCIKSDIHTEINYVPMTINTNCFREVVNKCKEIGINNINIIKLVNQGRCDDYLELTDLDTLKFINSVKDIRDINIRVGNSFSCNCNNCKMNNSKVVIRYDGQVLLCERFKSITNDNNIYKRSLKECIKNL